MLPRYLQELEEDGYSVFADDGVLRMPFYAYLKDGSGETDMSQVDGSGTPIEFTLAADPTHKITITDIHILVADSSIRTERFGNAKNPLTNGIAMSFVKGANEGFFFEDVNTIGDLHIACGGQGSTIRDILDNRHDGYLGKVNKAGLIMNIPAASTTDTIKLYVKDDMTHLSKMFVRVIGYKEIAS